MFDTVEAILNSLDVAGMLSSMQVNKGQKCSNLQENDFSNATELSDYL